MTIMSPGRSTVLMRCSLALILLSTAGASSTAAPQAAAATAGPVAAQEQSQCLKLFSFTQTDLISLDWTTDGEKRIEVASADLYAYKLNVRITDLVLKDGSGKLIPTSDLIAVEPLSPLLDNGSLIISLRLKSTLPIKPGIYLGSLLVSGDASDPAKKEANACIIRRQVQLIVPYISPLIEQATIHAYRMLPFTSLLWCNECDVPLKSEFRSETTSIRKGTLLGVLKREQGGIATVLWTGQTGGSAGGALLLPLEVAGISHAGQYKGQLKLNPASEKAGNVDLTLNVADFVLWPILVVAFSIWLSLRTQRYINVERLLWKLQEQEAALGVLFRESQRDFALAALDSPYASYSIAASITENRRRLREQIAALRASSSLTLDQTSETYKSIIATFKSLRELSAIWVAFAGDLRALETALKTNGDVGKPPPGVNDNLPGLLASYAELLIGREITVEQFLALQQDVRNAAMAATLWFTLKNRIEKDKELLAQLKANEDKLTEESKAKLKSTALTLREVLGRLWVAKTVTELTDLIMSGGDLDLTERSLRAIAGEIDDQIHQPGGTLSMTSTLHDLQSLSDAFTPISDKSDAPAGDAERERYFATAIRRWDTFMAWLAFIIAVLTGLNVYYLGKPFGTIKDYVELLLWGIGTKIVVDTMSMALGWFYKSVVRDRLPQRT